MSSVFRIDTFVVPDHALEEFRQAARRSVALLRDQAGFVRDQWFERVSGPGRINIITLVEWDDVSRLSAVGAAMRAEYQKLNFNPEGFTANLGIEENKAVFIAVEG